MENYILVEENYIATMFSFANTIFWVIRAECVS